MANNSDLTITIKANSSAAEAALQKIVSKVQAMTGQIDKSSNQASSGFGKIATVASALGNIISNVVTSAWSKMTAQIDSAIQRFDTMNNFPKVMSNLGIASDKSQKAIAKISNSLKGLPTALDTAAMSVQRLTAKNGDIEKSTELFLAMNNAVLAGGAPMNLQQAALEQLTQAYAKGKPDMVEWRSMMTAMPAQLKQVATAMGYVSADALGEALRSGKVSMDDFMDTFVRLNKDGIEGFASFEQQARSATGGIQTGVANMQTAITRGWTKILDAIGSTTINQSLADTGERFEWLLGKVATFINYLQNHRKEVDLFASSILALSVAVGILATVTYWDLIITKIGRVGSVFGKFIGLFTRNPILAAVLIIVGALTVFFSKTEAGQKILQQLGKIMSDVFGKVGPVVSQVFEAISKVFSDIASKAGPVLANIFSTIGNVIADLAAKVGPVLVQVFSTIGTIFASLAAKALPIVANLFAQLGVILQKIMPFVGELIGRFAEIVNTLFPTLVPLLEAVMNLFIVLGQSVVQIAVALFQALQPLIPLIIQIVVTVAKLVANIASALVPIIKLIIQLVVKIIQAIVPIAAVVIGLVVMIIQALLPIISFVIDLVSTIIQAITPLVTTIISVVAVILNIVITVVSAIINAIIPIISFIVGAVTTVINVVTPILAFIINLVAQIIAFIAGAVVTIINIVIAVITAVINVISGIISFVTGIIVAIINIIGGIIDAVAGILSVVVGLFSDAFNGIVNFIKGAVNSIVGFFQSIPNYVGQVVDKIVSFFSGVGKKIGDFVASAFKSVINGALKLAEDFLNGPIKLINGALDIINGIPGVNISKITEIKLPRMATGNVATEPMVGIFGEYANARNNPEITSPRSIMFDTFMSAMTDFFGRSSGGNTFNFTGDIVVPAGTTAEQVKSFLQEVVRIAESQGVDIGLKNVGEIR